MIRLCFRLIAVIYLKNGFLSEWTNKIYKKCTTCNGDKLAQAYWNSIVIYKSKQGLLKHAMSQTCFVAFLQYKLSRRINTLRYI